jgi:predicted metal-dependent hydrolase
MDRRAAARALPEQLSLFGLPPGGGALRRDAILAGRRVEYRFARRRRRTIAITVDARGLSVSAPLNAAWREIEAFLLEKQRWIVARLDEWADVPRAAPVLGFSGEQLPVFGEPQVLAVSAGRSGVRQDGTRLCVSTPDPAARHRVIALLRRWFRAQALAALAPRSAAYAARLGRSAPAVSISSAERQWGLCTAQGTIRYSWRLAHLAPSLADYVVAHEVAHLVELNHSKRFWRVVESLYPEWRQARTRLEREGAALPLIGRAS